MCGEIWKKFHYICKKYVKQLNAKDMKKGICLTVIAAVALLVSVSCNANKSTAPESSGASKVEAVKSDFSFLKKLGIDPADSLLIADEIDAERGQMALLALDDNQRRALLKGIADDDEIDFGVFSIAGIRALPGGFTLVAYHIELGDGSGGMVAVYDRDGKVTDMALTGAWNGPEVSGVGECDFPAVGGGETEEARLIGTLRRCADGRCGRQGKKGEHSFHIIRVIYEVLRNW